MTKPVERRPTSRAADRRFSRSNTNNLSRHRAAFAETARSIRARLISPDSRVERAFFQRQSKHPVRVHWSRKADLTRIQTGKSHFGVIGLVADQNDRANIPVERPLLNAVLHQRNPNSPATQLRYDGEWPEKKRGRSPADDRPKSYRTPQQITRRCPARLRKAADPAARLREGGTPFSQIGLVRRQDRTSFSTAS